MERGPAVPRMHRLHRGARVLVAAMLTALGMLLPGVVQAHAVLVGSSPEAGARLARAPAQLRLEFNEPVSVVALRVLDGAGGNLAGPARTEGRSVHAPLSIPQADTGRYIVSYRVSSADSHPVAASFEFAVGGERASTGMAPVAASPGSPIVRDGQSAALWPAVAVRALLLAMLAIVVGATLFGFVAGTTAGTSAAAGRGLIVACGVGVAASLLSIGLEGALALGEGAAALADAQAWRLGYASTRGTAALASGTGFACLGLALAAGLARWRGFLNGLGIVAALSAFVLAGHGATAEPQGLAQGLWMLHVLCALGWIGSLPPLIAALGHGAAAARLARRFSGRALVAVPLLLGAGLVMAAIEGGAAMFRADFTLDYFEVLGIKLCLVSAMLVLALWNRLALLPRFEAGEAAAARLLAWSIRAELLTGFAILATAALLSHQMPPRSLAVSASAPEVAVLELTAAGGSTRLRVRAAAGGEALLMDLRDAAGRPLRVQSLGLALASATAGIESLPRALTPDAGGGWRLPGQSVPGAGRWRVEIDVLVSDFERHAFQVLLDKGADGRLALRRADAQSGNAGRADDQIRSSR
jgi:copper transport protein